MAVDVQCRGNIRMPQQILYGLDADSRIGSEVRRKCMPVGMTTELRQQDGRFVGLQKRLIVAVPDDAAERLVQHVLLQRHPEAVEKHEKTPRIAPRRLFADVINTALRLQECTGRASAD